MQSPSRAVLAPDESRATRARYAILFVAGASPRTVDFALKRMRELFGYEFDEAELRAAQMELLREATTGLTAARRGGRS